MSFANDLHDTSTPALDHMNSLWRLNSGLAMTDSHEETPIRSGGPCWLPARLNEYTLRTAILVSNGQPTGQVSLAQICTPPSRVTHG